MDSPPPPRGGADQLNSTPPPGSPQDTFGYNPSPRIPSPPPTHSESSHESNSSAFSQYERSSSGHGLMSAIEQARRQRVSQNPPLPGNPYTAPPRPITPTPPGQAHLPPVAGPSIPAPALLWQSPSPVPSGSSTPTSTSASAAGSSNPPFFSPAASSLRPTPSPVEMIPPPPPPRQQPQHVPSAVRLSRPDSLASLSRGASRAASRARTRTPGYDDDEHPTIPRPQSSRGLSFDAGAVARYSFLRQDPAYMRSDTPSSMRNGRRASASASEPARQIKTLSGQSALSLYSDPHGYAAGIAPSSVGHDGMSSSEGHRGRYVPGPYGWGAFGQSSGGTGAALAALVGASRRDSGRSFKSSKSTRSTRSTKKRRSKHASQHASPYGQTQPNWEDEESLELWDLVRRAAVLERLLRTGKRASAVAGRQNNRFSSLSMSTRMSSHNSHSRHGHTMGAWNSSSASRTHADTPMRHASAASSSGKRRSAKSVDSSSLRTRLARRLGRQRHFTGLGSDDEADNYVDLADGGDPQEFDEGESRATTPATPPRRALSTSFSRGVPTPPPGAGTGVIVFPELAALPPVVSAYALRRDGEVCAQACLPPSRAIPYHPLPPLPASESWSSSQVQALDEKTPAVYSHYSHYSTQTTTFGNADVPACDQKFRGAGVKRVKILIAVGCVLGIIIITGLLAGLLSSRGK